MVWVNIVQTTYIHWKTTPHTDCLHTLSTSNMTSLLACFKPPLYSLVIREAIEGMADTMVASFSHNKDESSCQETACGYQAHAFFDLVIGSDNSTPVDPKSKDWDDKRHQHRNGEPRTCRWGWWLSIVFLSWPTAICRWPKAIALFFHTFSHFAAGTRVLCLFRLRGFRGGQDRENTKSVLELLRVVVRGVRHLHKHFWAALDSFHKLWEFILCNAALMVILFCKKRVCWEQSNRRVCYIGEGRWRLAGSVMNYLVFIFFFFPSFSYSNVRIFGSEFSGIFPVCTNVYIVFIFVIKFIFMSFSAEYLIR